MTEANIFSDSLKNTERPRSMRKLKNLILKKEQSINKGDTDKANSMKYSYKVYLSNDR